MHVILPTALEIASALAYLHSNNVLHGAPSRQIADKPLYIAWLQDSCLFSEDRNFREHLLLTPSQKPAL